MTPQHLADTLKDDPKRIIEWAKREIKEYQALIKILTMKKSPRPNKKQKTVKKGRNEYTLPKASELFY